MATVGTAYWVTHRFSPRLNCRQLGSLESTDWDICLMLQRDASGITLYGRVLAIRSVSWCQKRCCSCGSATDTSKQKITNKMLNNTEDVKSSTREKNQALDLFVSSFCIKTNKLNMQNHNPSIICLYKLYRDRLSFWERALHFSVNFSFTIPPLTILTVKFGEIPEIWPISEGKTEIPKIK